jgi:hypothetical protein
LQLEGVSEGVLGAGGVGADRADHRGRDEGEVGFEGKDLLGCGQLDHGPAGSVVDPVARTRSRSMRNAATIRSAYTSSIAPWRMNGGAANDRPPSP